MGREIDLLRNYPKAKRNLTARAAAKTEADRAIARQFGRDLFDGDRRTGYGGFTYDPRFWSPVVPDLIVVQEGSFEEVIGSMKGLTNRGQ